jgi:DNA-binding LytR/AlgR family response regulator
MEIETYSFNSSITLSERIAAGDRFDIYLLDIIMPEIDGIKLARQIRTLDENASLIFLTNSTEYALEAFGVSAVQYILKPVEKDALFPVLDKTIAARIQESVKFITVSASDGGMVKVLFSSIIAIEQSWRVMIFHLSSGEKLESKMIRVPFKSAIAQLLQDKRFLHVHQSFVINMSRVHKLCSQSFIMENGLVIPIPKPKCADLKNIYLEYLAQAQQ